MYNRYIPQHDGSFQRRSVQDHKQNTTPEPQQPQQTESPQIANTPHPPMGVAGFLRNLLPREFDTGDLIIVLLLLLMAGDSQEERNTALLTLALYFLM